MIILKEKEKIQEGISVVNSSIPELVIVNLIGKPRSSESLRTSNGGKVLCAVEIVYRFDVLSWNSFKQELTSLNISAWKNYGGLIANGITGVIKCICPESNDPPIYVNFK